MREKSEWKDQIKRSREIIIERLISSTKEEEETEAGFSESLSCVVA
jgi:hypothetical protein